MGTRVDHRGGHAAASIRSDERAHLARAVALAQPAVVRASPNPGVGCVLVRDGEVVGEGATRPIGGPHAEVEALRAAGPTARGATAYVTLEPCAHHGRTPPCADALADAGVARVVHLHPDPHASAAGGAARLRDRDVEVAGPPEEHDLLRAAVNRQLEAFLTSVALGRPHVTLKLAQTADGALSAPDGARWLTGPTARRAVHRWRSVADAVLVGSGTVVVDDPRLDVRDVPTDHQPRPVILDARLRTPPSAAVARPGAVVLTRPDGTAQRDGGEPAGAPVGGASRAARRRALEDLGVEVVDVRSGGAAGGGLDLHDALTTLRGRGIARVFAEPGATLSTALIEVDLVDRLVLHVALHLGDGVPRRAVPGPPAGPWRTERCGGAGQDLVLHLVPTVRATSPSERARPAGGS